MNLDGVFKKQASARSSIVPINYHAFSLIEASEQESVIVEYGDDSEDENQDDSDANTPPETEVEDNNHSDDEEDIVSESDDIIAKEIIDFLNSPTAEDDEEHQGELDNSFDNTNSRRS